MKKAALQTFLALVAVNLIITFTKNDLPKYYSETEAVVVSRVEMLIIEQGDQFNSNSINGKYIDDKYLYLKLKEGDCFYEHPFMHTFLTLKKGDKVKVAYYLSSHNFIGDVVILDFWTNFFAIDKIFINLFVFGVLFSALYNFGIGYKS